MNNGRRAGDVIDGLRALIKKTPPVPEGLDINEVLDEIITLTRMEAAKNRVSVRKQFAEGLPPVPATRAGRLQQVILNLIVNASEAMSEVDQGVHDLQIATGGDATQGVLVTVRDSGRAWRHPRSNASSEAFYTVSRPAWDRAADLPLDRRGSWRTVVGECDRRAWRRFPVHAAPRPGIVTAATRRQTRLRVWLPLLFLAGLSCLAGAARAADLSSARPR